MNIAVLAGNYLTNATASFVSLEVWNATTPKQIGTLFKGTFLSDFIIPNFENQNTIVANVRETRLFVAVNCQVTYVDTEGV